MTLYPATRPGYRDRLAALAPRERRAATVVAGCAAFLVLSLFLALGIGAVPIPPDVVGRLILEAVGVDFAWETETRDALVFWSIRVPRVAAGCLVGASLALAGATMQGIFRNPLADPALIGVSSGAALAAVAVIVIGGGLVGTLPPETRAFALPAAALAGGVFFFASILR